MKRRVLSLGITLALCLNLCPVWVLAAGETPDSGLCPHHPVHTEECGYIPPAPGQDCTHEHDDDCYTIITDCVHEHTAKCYSAPDYDPEVDEPDLCTHVCTEDSGCVTRTLTCPHEHDDTCGCEPENPGAPCTFVCPICPIDDLIARLPRSVSAYNSEQVQAQLDEIFTLYDQLTADEQQQVDLSPCLALWNQVEELDTAELNSDLDDSLAADGTYKLLNNKSLDTPLMVSQSMVVDTNGFTLTGTSTNTIEITGDGILRLKGTVVSNRSAGVQVQSGGSLTITEPGTSIKGFSYALDIASGANVRLSAGTYFGQQGAIQTEDGDFAALLAPGYAYFDETGGRISLTELASSAPPRTVVVARCTDHDKVYTPIPGDIRHTWTCSFCGETGTEPCTFTFEDETGVCDLCGNEITVTVDRNSLKALAYDENIKPANGAVTVTTKDGTTLTGNTHYTVTYATQADMGSTDITVTVTVKVGDNQGTFTQDYTFTQAELSGAVLEWSQPGPVNLPYDGDPVEASELPSVIINNINSNGTDLHQYLQYSYRVKAPGATAYTDGLPTNAGTYEVVVSLPEKPTTNVPGYQAASSEPITLMIEKISPIDTPPRAIQPEFNGAAQKLVTPGTLHSAAARDGVEILFATSEHGTYLPNIPTGVNAGGNYEVWYQTEETENYLAVGPFEIDDVEIQRKKITPIVKLSEYTYLYDGGEKEPKVTVKDEDDVTELLDTEYQVKYVNNRNVSTDGNPAKVVVSDKDGGNYEITEVEVEFKITSKEQATLTITNKPNTVTYGDKFTLETNGGSGNGEVTWKITDGTGVAEVGENSGQVIIVGHGSFTVQATKSGKDPVTGVTNYDDATAPWTITADKKSVVATVTAEDKSYDGGDVAAIHAVVETGVLPGDQITITDLEGTFSDENAGADKTVTVNVAGASISGKNSDHYDVSYSSTTVTATIHKAIANIKIPPNGASLTYNGASQALINDDSLAVDPNSVRVEYAMSEGGPYFTTIPEETNAGAYTVWYRVQETPNYTGLAPASVDVEIRKKSVTPDITLSGDGLRKDDNSASPIQYYIYDGTAKKPAVTLNDENGNEISGGEYTVAYSNNTDVGIATVTVTAKEDGNYSFTPNPAAKDFRIKEEQAKVTTAPEPAGLPLTFSTYAQKLVTAGGGTGGTMVYFLADPADPDNSNGTYGETIPTATNAGEYTVYYKVAGDGNHSDSTVGQVKVTIAPKTVKDPTIELELLDGNGDPIDSYTYDGNPKKPTVTVKDGSDVIGAGEYNIIYSDNVDAGKGTVDITDKPGGNYTVTGSATFVILKADIKFAPDPSDAQAVYNGTAQELLKPGITSGGEVLYALNSPTSTYTAAIPTLINAGQYTVYYKVVGDKNHNDFAVQSVTANILPKPLTSVTIELSPSSFEYDGRVKLPEVTVMDGKTVLPEEEYTWSCGVPNPTNEGTYTITIANAAGGNYDLDNVTDKTATFTIGKTTQAELVIDHSGAVTTDYGDTFALSASGGSSSSTVTWIATGPATVDTDGNVEITGVGEVTITATNPGDQNYLPVSAQWTFTAAPKPVTASVVVASRKYDGTTDATVTSASIASADLVDSGDVVTIDQTSITAEFDTASVGTGKTVTLDTSRVKADGKDAAKYAISYPATVTANITQETTTFTTDPKKIDPLTYTGQPQELVTAGETNVGFIVYSLDGTDFSPEIPTGTDAGDYTVYYKVDGTADYTAEAGGSITVTIDRKSITATVELSESSYVYDSAKHEPSITVKDGRTVIDEDQYTVVWKDDDNAAATDVLTNVGTYTATITGSTTGNYDFTATARVEIVPASQAALTITGKPDHVYYGDTIRSLSTTGGTGQGTVAWSVTAGETSAFFDPGTSVLHINGIGSITVEAKRTVPNYGTVSDTWTFTVEPKPVVAEVTVTARNYDGNTAVNDGDITAVVKAGDLVDPDNDTITINGLMGSYDNANAGTNKTVTLNDSKVTITGDTGKYAVSCPATVKAVINPRPVSVSVVLSGNDLETDRNTTPPTYSYEYDGTEKKPAVTVEGTDASGYQATLAPSDYTVSYAGNKNVGTATVTVTSAEGGNYAFTAQPVSFAIRAAGAILTRSPQANDLTYTGQPQELVTVGAASGGHLEYSLDSGANWQTTVYTATNADTYVVSYKVVGDDNHTDGPSGSVTVTIKPKEIVSPKITVNGTYTYDSNPQIPDIIVEDGATVIPATEYSVRCRDNIDAGTATVIITNASGGNYIVNGTATFTIGKAEVENAGITPPVGRQNLPYNGTAQGLVTAGAASGGTMVYSLNQSSGYSTAIPTAKEVNHSYTVWYKVQGDDNHKDTSPASVTASIVMNNVTDPTIQVTPGAVPYNGETQEPVVTVYDNNDLVIDSSEYMVTYEDSKGNSVSNPINADEYTVKIKNTANSNYVIDDSSATFTISLADQPLLTITGTRERVYYGDTFQLSTTGGSGTVTWTVGSGDPATITNGLLTINGVGSVTVTATSTAAGYTEQKATWTFIAEKKPVTAVVTAEARTYKDGDRTATVTATLQGSDLVGNDVVKITLSGSFEDPNAGTGKKVNVDSSKPAFSGDSTGYANYNITYPATTTASILKADIDEDDVDAPEAVEDLEYTGNPQNLVTVGSAADGAMEYSTDNITYSSSLPTGTNAGNYDVWYRVKGDENHNDLAGKKLNGQVTIAPQTVDAPVIEFTPNSVSYDGAVHQPSVRVKDKNGRVIPETEYTVDYDSATDWTKAGSHTVTITDKNGGNYTFNTATKDFIILVMGQNPLSIGNLPGTIYYGDTFRLEYTGGSGTGAVTWESSAPQVASIDTQSGWVTVRKSGAFTIVVTKAADNNYSAQTASYTFSAEKKPVTAIVTARDKEYDATNTADLVVTWKDGALVGTDSINLVSFLKGTFDNASVGTNKPVTIALNSTLPDDEKYLVSWNPTTTASITPKAAALAGANTVAGLEYTGSSQALISGVTATNGTVVYSRDGVKFTQVVPAETNAGTYTFWYKALADENYKDSPAVEETVTIEPKPLTGYTIKLSQDTFEYDGRAKEPGVVVMDGSTVIPAGEYTVSYSDNVQPGSAATVSVENAAGGNYSVASQTAVFTIKSGAATLTLPPEERDLTYTGSELALVRAGIAVNGHLVYSLNDEETYSPTIPKGKNAGIYTVWYKVEGDEGYSDTAAQPLTVTIKPMTVNPSVTLILASDPLPYTGTAQKPTSVTVAVNGTPLTEYTDYTIRYSGNINPGTATVEIQSVSGSNYQFYTTRTFEIAKTKAAFAVDPKGRTDLVYTGEEQELIAENTGISLEGIVVYSRNAVTYSADIPTGTKAGAYTIFAKVLGNSTHEDSDVKIFTAEIKQNVVKNPAVELPDGNSFSYTGSPITPAVIVRDDSNRIIPATEYTVSYENNTAVSPNSAKVKITSQGSNYSFTAEKTFAIVGANQLLTITGMPDTVYYGDELNLIATGGSGGVTVTWTASGPVDDLGSGRFKITGSGNVTITAAKAADGNYGAATGTLEFYAGPRPVKATVTAKDKPYDGKADAELSVIFSGLLPGESISESGCEVKGQFSNAEAGTGKTVTISLTVTDAAISAKYAIDYNRTATASITPVAASVAADPQAIADLKYTGNEQELVTDGAAVGGNLAYSLNGVDYTPSIPRGKDAGPYTVWYKAVASDGNYKDSGAQKMTVTIAPYTGTLTVECTPDTFRYDNTAKAPATIRVLDSNNRTVPEGEYSVTVPSNAIAADTYTVTVKDIRNSGNYEFENPVTGTFKIEKTSQEPLSIIASEYTVHYGDTFRLSTTGGSGSGAIHWSIAETAVATVDGNGVATVDGNGVVTVTGTGSFTVEAYQEASGGYEQSNTASVTFYADPKPVRPVVTAKDKTFDGTRNAVLSASLEADALVKGDNDIQLTVGGQFDTADVGTGKQVEITSHSATGANVSKYQIIWPVSTTASIAKADAAIDTPPAARDLTYSTDPQDLVIGGSTLNDIGVIKYSRTQDGVYSAAIPKGTDAGTYSVWYKVEGSANYTGVDPAEILVTIAQAKPTIKIQLTASGMEGQTLNEIGFSSVDPANVPGTVVWKNGTIKPTVGTSQQDAIFMPADAANYEAIPIQITVTIRAASGTGSSGTSTTGTGSTPATSTTGASMQTTVRNGTASTVVSAAAGSSLVREAAANQSQSIVIQPEITGEVTKTEVSIPASTVSQIGRETSAALTVSAPIADVTIPNAALDTLSSAGGTVSVATEQVEQTVVLTLTAGGETVESVPGGVTLTVPVEDAGPGTVAVLVNEDGTRETLRKVVVEDGSLSIPLSGSAAVEIVDNSKDFTDVPATSWAADAVAFASAHELFSGTSETTFSPEETMSRGMLVTVLYRLEGLPPQELTSLFNDVSSEDWYADSIAWAAENGITNGYGNGQFGPEDSVTREQFVVMLWKYAGGPVANGRTLSFTDADQVSSYALEALCWAVENGILSGYSDGQLAPGGTATRAQAAQMLKNFMENI